MDVGAAPGEARGAVDDQLVAGESDAHQVGLGGRLAATHAAALGIRGYEVDPSGAGSGSGASTPPSASLASG